MQYFPSVAFIIFQLKTLTYNKIVFPTSHSLDLPDLVVKTNNRKGSLTFRLALFLELTGNSVYFQNCIIN